MSTAGAAERLPNRDRAGAMRNELREFASRYCGAKRADS
jgi:hypothetical protein